MGRRATSSSASASSRSSSSSACRTASSSPQVRKALELAERDSRPATRSATSTKRVAQRIGKVGTLAGLIVVVTIFFMVVQTLTALSAERRSSTPRCRSRCSTPASAASPCCTSAWSRCRRRTSSTSATRRCSPTGRATRSGCASGSGAIAELLLGGGAKLLVIACNTATSIGEDVAREVAAEHGVEVVPVVEPQAEIAAAITDSGRVGVLATPNTVESGAYRRALEGAGPGARGDRGRGARPGALHPGRLALRRGRGGDGARLLRAAEARRGRHPDPRLHPLPAGRADAAAHPRPRRAPGQRRPRGRRRRPAHPRVGAAWPASPTARATTASSAPATSTPSASSAPASCRCRSARSSGSSCLRPAIVPYP